jgi:hypothetical protein
LKNQVTPSNEVWCEIVDPACELLAWTQMLAFAVPPTAGTTAGQPGTTKMRHDQWWAHLRRRAKVRVARTLDA